MAFLTRHDLLQKDHLPPSSENAAVQKALGVLETMNFKPEERETYEDRLKWMGIEANTLKKYEADGFEKGIEKASYTLAINLLNLGIPIKKVSEVTELPTSILKNLEKS